MRIFSEDAIKVGNLLYLFGTDINMLYSIDLKDGDLSFISKIPEENVFKRRQVSKIVYWDNKLYLLPLSAKKIWIYSIIDKIWEKVEIEDYENNWADSYFRNAVIYKNHMFVFGGYYPAILIFNLETYEMRYVKEPFLRKKNINCRDLFFRGEPLKQGTLVYLASSIDNTVLIFDMEDYNYRWVKVGNKKNSYAGIEWDGSNFWLAFRNEPQIVKWDGKDKVIEYKCKNNIDFSNGKFIGIIKTEDGYIVPFRGKKANSLFVTKDGNVLSDGLNYIFYKRIEDEYIFQCTDGKVHYINSDGIESIYENSFKDDGQFILEIKKYDENLKDNFYENEPFTLKEWLSILV